MSNKTFPWNETIKSTRLWDPNADGGKGKEFTNQESIKAILTKPDNRHFEDIMKTICQAVVMIMDEIEKSS